MRSADGADRRVRLPVLALLTRDAIDIAVAGARRPGRGTAGARAAECIGPGRSGPGAFPHARWRSLGLLGVVAEEHRTKLLAIADRCPVHQTLLAEVDVATTTGAGA